MIITSINKVTLLGNVGNIEVKEVSGVKVATFSIATTKRGYQKQDGTQVPDRTEWHNCEAWRQTAEQAERFVKKGQLLYVEGEIKNDVVQYQDGSKRTFTKIDVNTIAPFLAGKSSGDVESTPASASSAPGGVFGGNNDNDGLPF